MKAVAIQTIPNETQRSQQTRLHAPPPDDPQIPPETTQNQETPRPKPKPPKRSQADRRVDFLLKKHFDNDPDFRPLVLKLAEYDPTPKKKYLAWLVKHWAGDWSPGESELTRVKTYLEIHQKGAKYFSPLSWTGLLLEKEGYHVDIFRYTPETLKSLDGPIDELIQIDEENKRIRKGDLVITAGAEIAYQDEEWTILRIRSDQALRRLGQGTSWCVRHGNMSPYRFPFDFILSKKGERYLANGGEVRDRWDNWPPFEILKVIKRLRKLATDSFDRKNERFQQVAAIARDAIGQKQRLDTDKELQLFDYPELAIAYAEGVIGGPWLEFEEQVRVSDLPATLAVDYAIRCRRDRWQRFENKIKRSVQPKVRYRIAFPGSIPKTEEEVFAEEIRAWRSQNPGAHPYPMRNGTQGLAEDRRRDIDRDRCLLRCSQTTIEKYARLFASLVTSDVRRWYTEKLKSYFKDFESEVGHEVNLPIARLLCRRFRQRVQWLEPMIAKDAVCSMNYALGMGERFIDGETVIRDTPKLWATYQKKFFKPEKEGKRQSERPRLTLPAGIRTAWM